MNDSNRAKETSLKEDKDLFQWILLPLYKVIVVSVTKIFLIQNEAQPHPALRLRK